MRVSQNFGFLYILLVICQILICNYCQITPYILVTMLPVMILCIPLSVNTISCMIIAFLTGLSVDWLSEGLIGINACALVPVALARKGIIRIFLGEDIISRSDSFSFKKNGALKISIALITSIGLFLTIYIVLDGAGTKTVWFNISRFFASLSCCYLLGVVVTNLLSPDDRK